MIEKITKFFTDVPPVGFYFRVSFLTADSTSETEDIDMRFQRVSGLSAEVTTSTQAEGGLNLFSHQLPERISYQQLVLERGMVIGSPLSSSFDEAMSAFQFKLADVLVMLLNEQGDPVANWLFTNSYPVKWSVSDLDANESKVVIETLAFAYQQIQRFKP